ncbi:MAG: asparagine synthase B [Spirochaetes bacterium]|nr:asparagine synthase B [Spirochaetota bacterium]
MCGIVAATKSRNIDRLLHLIRHRGPDDCGILREPEATLGHRRLSIIDVDGGHQPIANEDGTVSIVFNGEIYNFKQLYASLSETHTFSTRTDTEVILHLFEEMGASCVEKLDGMFAFAIFDAKTGELFLARDRLGIKPLYSGTKDGTHYFASELKTLAHCDDIAVFPPGHTYSSIHGYAGYFTLPSPAVSHASGEEHIHNIRKFLFNAVEKRMIADVPVGVFLSGGLDSSIIAAIMRTCSREVHSFAVGMKGSDDLANARIAAAHLGTTHHEFVYTSADMEYVLSDVIYYLESYDAPLVRSAIPCYFVSRLAHTHGIKVVLTGEGADELFSGYRYLKDIHDERALEQELVRITYSLHHTNLQRVDRMTMAHGVEARVPFLDIDFLTYVFSIPVHLKAAADKPEKWLLREAFRDLLPAAIIDRPKQKFSAGAGSMHVLETIADDEISTADFEQASSATDYPCRTKEELLYRRIFTSRFPEKTIACIGFTGVF